MYLREACVENLAEAIQAEKQGADRLELCSRLDLDGLTPSFNLVRQVLDNVSIPVMVMIRPRAGDFEYSEQELDEMKREIVAFKNLNIAGFVFGVLSSQHIDIGRTRSLAELASPFEICFHKAIDEVEDIIEAVEQLADIKQITRILTSGGASTAEKGIGTLQQMIDTASGKISIMPAGKIRPENIDLLHQKLNAIEYHGRSIVVK